MCPEGQLRLYTDFWYVSDSWGFSLIILIVLLENLELTFLSADWSIGRGYIAYESWVLFGELEFLNPAWFLRLSEALWWIGQWTITFDQPHSSCWLFWSIRSDRTVLLRPAAHSCTVPEHLSTSGFSCSAWLRALKMDGSVWILVWPLVAMWLGAISLISPCFSFHYL